MLPAVRKEARQLIIAQQPGAGEPAEETTVGFSLAQGSLATEDLKSADSRTEQ
jgi:hypothetical protein